ncbi:MAG TPA: cytochrome c oxidase assembly protein [Paracoccaceae bacterium]|nr:cytochrome c oxidase assembly protein [Paracoccaceae bacterium]
MTPQRRTAFQLAGVALLMLSLSFAAVPFYDWFCRVTGYGGTIAAASAAPDTILDQTIRVRFDASKEAGMPWDFVPMQREMVVRYGEVGLAFYRAHNPTDRPVAGTASFNVTPDSAGGYFTKIDCFCFQQQTLQPGESVEMPVTFYVDPALTTDREGRFVRSITLSYTFHQTPLPEEQAAVLPPAAPGGAAN